VLRDKETSLYFYKIFFYIESFFSPASHATTAITSFYLFYFTFFIKKKDKEEEESIEQFI
jgi:hypothetical protein